MADFTLVTGGARSGKSSFAELLATHYHLPVTYIATAQIWDTEMAARVQKHRQSRPPEWKLIEEPLQIRDTLLELRKEEGVILLDCVTLWLTNLLLKSQDTEEHLKDGLKPQSAPDPEAKILTAVREVAKTANQINPAVIFVTNEVGQGIVPENPLARTYRDIAGRANQILADAAASVYFVIAGYPIEIKQQGQKLLDSLRLQE